ncbi:MAG TPA: class I SAM-dependent methyltransferase [Longimicrobium sp.]|jgi:SAM-dependent methyltransferase
MHRPDEEFTYDTIADAYAESIEVAPYNAYYERPTMLGLLPPVNGKRILEVGCGEGWYTERLLARGAHVTGFDASAQMLEHARRRLSALPAEAQARVELREADLRRPLEFAAGAGYDGIVSALVMHYVRDWSIALSEFRRVLAPGGWLLFSTHHPAADAARLKEGESYFDVVQEEDYWKRCGRVLFYRRPLTAISDALADAGFGIERIVEPIPGEAFRQVAKPGAYAQMLRFPEFIFFLARPW